MRRADCAPPLIADVRRHVETLLDFQSVPLRSLSFMAKRIVCGVLFVFVVLSAINQFLLEPGFFPSLKKYFLGVASVIAFLVILVIGPSMHEVEGYRADKDRQRGHDA
jgi:hypothetical protein